MTEHKEIPIEIIQLEQERKSEPVEYELIIKEPEPREPVELILVRAEPKPREEPTELKIVWT